MLHSKYKKLVAIGIGLFFLMGIVLLLTETALKDQDDTFTDPSSEKDLAVDNQFVSEEQIESDRQEEVFRLADAQWTEFARVFDENCEVVPDGDLQPNGAGFKSMIEKMEPVKILPDNSQVYIVQCMLYAYQTSQLLVLYDYDGNTYIPLKMVSLNEDGTEFTDYPVVGLEYIPTSDSFISHSKGRGLGDCSTAAEYKLIDKKMVLQKFEADWKCDGEFETETMYDVSTENQG